MIIVSPLIELKHSDRMRIGVSDVFVANTVLAGALGEVTLAPASCRGDPRAVHRQPTRCCNAREIRVS